HPGYAVTDTFPVTIHKPVVTNIYNGDSTLPSALWQTKRWGIVTDQQIKKRVLDDSPNGKYPRNDTNILQYRPYLDLRGQTSAFLDVNTRWSLDANYDFATLEFSINGGTDWFTLPSRRMKQGVGVNAQEFEQYGFAGNFPEYSNESIDLTDLCGSQLLMRYVVRSDGVNEFDGWKISRIQLRTYQDTGTGVSDSVMPLRVFPNPATTSLNLIGIEGETTVTLYSSIGEQMSVFTYEAQSGIGERIPLPPLSSGVYQLRISNGNTSFMKQVVIAR
ncbi:MAG: T9SS type A sorting domain-containing protein, partial [Candidatus Kapabacteria bacterium]|nr:T9SS type A sorting domain-containing protein [Candidatus Kapabacteria bacterium]